MGQVPWGTLRSVQVKGYDAIWEDIKEREPPRKGKTFLLRKEEKEREKVNSVLLVISIYKKPIFGLSRRDYIFSVITYTSLFYQSRLLGYSLGHNKSCT